MKLHATGEQIQNGVLQHGKIEDIMTTIISLVVYIYLLINIIPNININIIFKKEIADADDPESTRDRLVEEYRNNFASPFKAAELGYIDQIIFPENTRPRLIQALMMLKDKKDAIPDRKHGNTPL